MCTPVRHFDFQPKWALFEIYRIWKSRPIKATFVGIYPDDLDSFPRNLQKARCARQDLDKIVLRAAVVVSTNDKT